MLYFVDFHVGYGANMTQKDLFTIWAKEATVALEAKKKGLIVDLWKCVGERRVIVIVDVDCPDTLDQILFTIPIMQEMGQHIEVKVTALRQYEAFAADINRWLTEET